MKRVCALLLLIAAAAGVVADDKPRLDPRETVEAYLSAVDLVQAAAAEPLVTEGTAWGKENRLRTLKALLPKTPKVTAVYASAAKGEAIAVTEEVKFAEPDPAGNAGGCLVFWLVKPANRWRIIDLDIRSGDDARDRVKKFRDLRADAKEVVAADAKADEGFVPLFPADGVPKGWSVREWNDLAKKAPAGNDWVVKDGVLHSGQNRGTWLVSDKEYADFVLAFEIKLTERGNSGVALRAPMKGDPAFDGMELQVADLRYNTQAKDSELTAGIYRAIAPTKQVYKPTEWNTFRIELKGDRLKATVNGEVVQDVDLTKFGQPVKRHDGTDAPPIKDRPRRGHIGFQHLSRNNEPVMIRNARLKELK